MNNNAVYDKTKISKEIDQFAKAMKLRMFEKYNEGWQGWDDPPSESMLLDFKERMLTNACQASHSHYSDNAIPMVDVANFAMMIWRMK
jgi:hypothetical protein